jgi:hypothetical protein
MNANSVISVIDKDGKAKNIVLEHLKTGDRIDCNKTDSK